MGRSSYNGQTGWALTQRQKFLMFHIVKAFEAGKPLTITQLNELTPNRPSKQATQCSLDFLAKKGFLVPTQYETRITKGQAQRCRLVIPSEKGVQTFGTWKAQPLKRGTRLVRKEPVPDYSSLSEEENVADEMLRGLYAVD
jgi:flagellar assembly factor FliW